MSQKNKLNFFSGVFGLFFNSVSNQASMAKSYYFSGMRCIKDIFKDNNLALLISEQLGKNINSMIICEELYLIKQIVFDLKIYDIKSFLGIEYLSGLRSVFIYDNKFEKIPVEFRSLTNLKFLMINNGNLKEIPDWIDNFVVLETLILTNQKIDLINEKIFTLKKIKNIDLTNNSINFIPDNIYKAVNLKQINISNNSILKLPENIIYLLKLNKIDLSNNKLILNENIFNYLITLNTLILNNTHIICENHVKFKLRKQQYEVIYKNRKYFLGFAGIIFILCLLNKKNRKGIFNKKYE